MKNLNVLKRGVFGLLVMGLVFTSCSDNDQTSETEAQLAEDTTEVERSAEIDQVDNVLGDLVIDAYEAQELSESGRSSYTGSIPECVTITLVAEQGYREITLDFGTEGCIVNGHLIHGKMVCDYTRDTEAQQIMINYNLIDFYFDAKNIIASRSILKELSNANGNPQFTHDLSITGQMVYKPREKAQKSENG